MGAVGRPGGSRARLVRVVEVALAAVLFGAMMVTVVDVAGRYLFTRPLKGADDLNGIAMALVIFLGLPLVTARGEHIRLDLLDAQLPQGLRRALGALFGVTAALILAVIAWRLQGMGATMQEFGDASPMLKIPLAPVAYALAALALLAAAIQLWLSLAPGPTPSPPPLADL